MLGARSAGMGAIDPHSDPNNAVQKEVSQNDPAMKRGPGDLDPDRLIDVFKQTYDYEFSRRKSHEADWDRAWERMNNRWNFQNKRPWQSQRGMPAVTILALRLGWEITKQLETTSGKWFEFETTNPSWQPLVQIPTNLVRWIMKSSDQPENNFFLNFYDMIVSGLLCENAVALVLPEEDGYANVLPDMEDVFGTGETKTPFTGESPTAGQDGGGFRLPDIGFGKPGAGIPKEEEPTLPGTTPFRVRQEAINPRYLLKDSAGRRILRYVMWSQDMTAGEFRSEGEKRKWLNIEEVIKDAVSSEVQQNQQNLKSKELRDKQLTQEKKLDTITLKHYWGAMYDPTTGERLLENHYYIMANDKYEVIRPIKNPFWHGQCPLITCGILRFPFSVYNKSFIGLGLDAQESRVEIMNLMLDFLKQAIVPPYEIDLDQFASTRGNQLANGISPGMSLYLEKGGKTNPAVGRSQVPDAPASIMTAVGFLEQKYQEFTGAGETGAMPRTRNRITAAEAKERMGASAGMMEQAYKNIEHSLLEPILYQTFLVTLQKIPQRMWKSFIQEQIDTIKGVTTEGTGQEAQQTGLVAKLTAMQSWSARDRFVNLGAAFRPSVTVFSAQFSKRENLEKLDMMAGMAQKVPQLGPRLRWARIGEDIVRNLDMDPARVLWPDTGETAEQPSPMLAAPPDQMPPPVEGNPNPGGSPQLPRGVPPPPPPR